MQELFKPYYASTMPLLKHILVSCNDRTQRRLCGKTLECISLIAMSVGRETFYGDASDFLHQLQQLNTMEMADDDPLVTYVQSAGTRMCKCLGEDFVPMLSTFVPPLVKSAGKKSTYQVRGARSRPPALRHARSIILRAAALSEARRQCAAQTSALCCTRWERQLRRRRGAACRAQQAPRSASSSTTASVQSAPDGGATAGECGRGGVCTCADAVRACVRADGERGRGGACTCADGALGRAQQQQMH